MKIGPVGNGGRPIRPEDNNKQSRPNEPRPDNDVRPQDTVEISPKGQDYGHRSTDDVRNEDVRRAEASLDSTRQEDIRHEKVEEARRRADSDYYNDLRIREEIANQIADDLLS